MWKKTISSASLTGIKDIKRKCDVANSIVIVRVEGWFYSLLVPVYMYIITLCSAANESKNEPTSFKILSGQARTTTFYIGFAPLKQTCNSRLDRYRVQVHIHAYDTSTTVHPVHVVMWNSIPPHHTCIDRLIGTARAGKRSVGEWLLSLGADSRAHRINHRIIVIHTKVQCWMYACENPRAFGRDIRVAGAKRDRQQPPSSWQFAIANIADRGPSGLWNIRFRFRVLILRVPSSTCTY